MIKIPETTLKEEWRYNYLWYCGNCGMGGLSTSTDLQCHECQHHRCNCCSLEGVWERKYKEEPRKRGVLRRSYPHPSPKQPMMSLTLLPKVPMEHTALTVSQEQNVDKLASLSYSSPSVHKLSPGKHTTTTTDEPRCIALSDISPATSPPGLSPSPTESSLYSSDSSNSEVASPTMTDVSSDTTSSTEEENEYEDSIESESEFSNNLLESRLFEVLGYDRELVAHLVPRIHALMQCSSPEDITIKVVASGAPGEVAQQTPSSSSGSVPTPSSSGSRMDLQHRKHKRDSEEDEEKKRNGGSKRPRKRFGHNSPRPSGFACPFHKKEPWKYVATNDIKYRTCAGPGPLEVRRVKEHLKSHHKPPQCERCYRIFEDVTQRTEHHKRAEICVQNGVELKEGIDDGQWQRIEALLKKSKKEPTREIKDQVEKWFEIWEVVFPNTPRPQDPWSDSNQIKAAPVIFEVADVVEMLDRVIARDIERGLLQRDDHVHGRYRLALREVWERAMAIPSQPLASRPLHSLESNSESRRLQDFLQRNGASLDHLLPAHLSSYGADQSPSGVSTTTNVQDAASQSWVSPQAQIENSTPISIQNSLVTQWGTPQESLTPAISTTQNTTLEPRDSSTLNSHFPSEMPSYELNAAFALPLQIEWDEEWEQMQNFELGVAISQRGAAQLGTSQPDSAEPVPGETFLIEEEPPGWQGPSDGFASNQSLTAILDSEIELPTAGAPIKDHRDRNKGLQGPLYED